ncbi:MAG: formyltetrahydrofolate deformylase, partial [Myxococcales bacterium]|nr:formyltetrahydrofolate deformylase [Myxococcales bacterium]
MTSTARLLITCPDQPGIIAEVTGFIRAHGANITTLHEHSTDALNGTLFMRLEFQTPQLDVSRGVLESAFEEVVARRFSMTWSLSYAADRKRTAVLVSKYDHAMMELLWRWRRGELDTEITAVVSNHEDLREHVEGFGVPFHVVPFTRDIQERAEAEIAELLDEVDLIVLARYMRILSGDFVGKFPNRIINIHHSFLPAFAGASPHRQAYEKGVKLIGATAHYVTAELDAGPIIEQDVVRVSHRDGVADLVRKGRDLEMVVLARAVRAHLEHRILVYGNKT